MSADELIANESAKKREPASAARPVHGQAVRSEGSRARQVKWRSARQGPPGKAAEDANRRAGARAIGKTDSDAGRFALRSFRGRFDTNGGP